jgi:subtilisin family serine protease
LRRIAGLPHSILLLVTLVLGGISRVPVAGAAPWPPPGGGPPQAAAVGPHPRWVDGEVLVAFKPDARPQDINAILKDLGAKRVHKFRHIPGERHKIEMPVAEAVAKYRHHPAIQYIEPNYIIHADAIPNDPSFPIQWSLRNTGQSGGTPGVDIHATAAWDQTTGSNQVIVAIIDTGIDMDHPDLAANLYTNPGEIPGNLVDDDGNGFVDDVHGFDFANFDGDPDDDNNHGTHVAGTIGAIGNNGAGIAGIVWHVRLLALKFLDQNGSGTTSDAVDCIDYAVAAGATVINASWGGGDDSIAMRLALSQANAAGILFVSAAGNSSANSDEFDNWPTNYAYDNIISVGSSDRSDGRSNFSNYGPKTVDLFAPGTQIVSTVKDGLYAVASGTSMAAPHVTGAVALLKSRFPGMNGPTMKQIILASTDRIPALNGLCVTGGRLNVLRMMDGVDSIPPNAPGNLVLANTSSDRLTIRWIAPGDDGSQGTATEYDLRISNAPIDDTNFLDAQRVAGQPTPHVAGTLEEGVIPGLTPLTGYYIALVGVDEFGNRSPLSNVVFAQTTAPPVASVQPGSVILELRTGQSVTQTVDLHNDGEGTLDFTARAMGPTGGGPPSWIRIDPLSGSVPASGRVPVTITLNAAGLTGGDYAAVIRLHTNDPAHADIDVTVAFHVISAPDIEIFPFPLPFGPVAVGETGSQGLLVTNAGFDDLHVTSITATGDGFSADETPFDLPPGSSWEILTTVTPTQTGPLQGILAIESDDPDEPSIRVPMEAQGIVPATIAVSPARESSALQTGETETRTFTITNSGGSSLSWTVRARSAGTLEFDSTGALVPPLVVTGGESVGPPAPPQTLDPTPPITVASASGPAAAAEQATDISDVRIVFDERHGGSSNPWGAFIGTLVGRGAVFSLNTEPLTDAVLSEADVYWISDGSGALTAAERAALKAWVRRGGSLLIEGEATDAAEFNALLDTLAVPVEFVANQGVTGFSTRIYPYEITRGVTAANLPSISRLRVLGDGPTVVFEDAQGYPAEAATFVGRGRVLTVGGRLFADVASIFVDNRKIATQSVDWLGGAAWLSVAPVFGTTAPGRSSTVTATFNASRLAAADYRAAIVFVSNDPAHSKFLVPVDLSLTGAPDVEVTPLSLDFGPVFVGASKRDSVEVQNVGVLPLQISSVATGHPDFTASPSSLSLVPGQIGWIYLTYAPGSVAPVTGTLTFQANDPDEPSISVHVAGSGIPAPDVEITSDSLNASLATGLSTTRQLTVRNLAGSDLDFFVHFEEEAPSSELTAASLEEALPRGWAESRAWALSQTQRVVIQPPRPPGPTTMMAPGSPDSTDLPIVLVDPRDLDQVADLRFLRASARGGELKVELDMGTDIVPANFGGYLSLDLDQNHNTGRPPTSGLPRQDIGAEYEIGFFSLQFGYVDLFESHTGNYFGSVPVQVDARTIRFSVPLSSFNGDDGRMNVSGVIGNAVGATDWFPSRGHGTVNGLWTAAAPAGGTLPAGTSQVVNLSVDALGLTAGTYRGQVVVDTNDPDELRLEVPASLVVSDSPIITVTSTREDLGQVFVGHTATREFLIGNTGTVPLHGTIAVDSTEFSVDVTSFTVAAGTVQPVLITFAPVTEGAKVGFVTITHDAPAAPISMLLSAESLIPPVLVVTPDSVATTIPLKGTGSVYLSVENRGGSQLQFGIEPLNRVDPVPQQAGLALARDEEDPRAAIHAADLGGPDAFGYRWVDSDEFGGPVFDWVEISAIGTPVPIRSLDQNSGPLPIGFPFPFYDRTFTTLNVCTHGYISFTDTTVNFGNQPLPSQFAPPNLLAIFWDDLNFAGVEHAYYYNDGTRLIVEYQNVLRRQKGGPFTFEAILYPNGAIVCQYLQMGAPTNSGTIGLQNRLKNDGLTVLFNGDGLRDRTAIRFSSAPKWLAVHQRSGQLDPGGQDSVQIAIDMRELFAGVYQGLVRVTSNDPLRPEKIVPVRLRAQGIPDILVSAASLQFDTLYVGESATASFRVTNQGTDQLEVSISGSSDFTSLPPSVVVAPLQSTEVGIRYAPLLPGDRSTALLLSTNDPDMPLVSIPITAAAKYRMRDLLADVTPSPLPRSGKGKPIHASVLLPSDLDAARVVLAGVRLQGTVPPILSGTRVLDLNGDGHADLDLAFDRDAAGRVLPAGDLVPVVITGELPGVTLFTARDTVRVVGKKTVAPGVELEDDLAPAVSALHQNAPNPFRASTVFRFDLASAGPATIRVYSANGRLVRTLITAPLPVGRFLAGWDGRDDRGADAPSGVYFVRLSVSGEAPFQTVRRWTRVR